MKKDLYSRQRMCSDFDDRPIYEPEDNLYADALDDDNHKSKKCPDIQTKQSKKLEIIRNGEKHGEN